MQKHPIYTVLVVHYNKWNSSFEPKIHPFEANLVLFSAVSQLVMFQ